MKQLKLLIQGNNDYIINCLDFSRQLDHDLLNIITDNSQIQTYCKLNDILLNSNISSLDEVCVIVFDEKITNWLDKSPLLILYLNYDNKKQLSWNVFFNQKSYVLAEFDGDQDSIQDSFEEILISLSRLENFHQIYDIALKESEFKFSEKQNVNNNTNVNDISSLTIHQLFEANVLNRSDEIAVTYNEDNLSFNALNKKSNQLARHIRSQFQRHYQKELMPGTLIPISVNRSINLLVGILGILKAGAAYVPVDPNYPSDRVEYILNDIDCKIMITQSHLAENIKQIPTGKNIVCINLDEYDYTTEDTSNLNVTCQSSDLAYVIYTSGTTGRPKGVMIEHHSVVNLIESQIKTLSLDNDSRVLLFTRITFDASVGLIFPTICSDAELFILPKQYLQDTTALIDYINKYKITTLSLVPNVLQMVKSEDIPTVKVIELGAESPARELVEVYSKTKKLINAYGPTECCVSATHYTLQHANENKYIGYPIQNVTVHVLDEDLVPVPANEIGELYISGEGVARGYLNQIELTHEKFIFLNNEKNICRAYKTNDLVRIQENGCLEFIGRNDFQVKIAGHRVELFSIDNNLREISYVKDSVTIFIDQGKQQLISFVIVDDTISYDIEFELKEFLKKQLPPYMIPVQIISIDEYPLTNNDKVDRLALSTYITNSFENKSTPRNDLEKILHDCWTEIFNKSPIGIFTDFYVLGGDSLKATNLLMKINIVCKKYNIKSFSLSFIFKYKTIAEQAIQFENMLSMRSQYNEEIKHIEDCQYYPMSKQQLRFYFLDQYDAFTRKAYIISQCFRLSGNLNCEALEFAVNQLLERHDVFSYAFIEKDNSYYQLKQRPQPIKFIIKHLNEDKIKDHVKFNIEQGFDFKKGYLYKFNLYKIKHKDEFVFSFIHHHIIADGWSLSVIYQQLQESYNNYINTKQSKSNQVKLNYGDYCIFEQKYLNSKRYQEDKLFWSSALENVIPLDLPAKHAVNTTNSGGQYTYTLNTFCHQRILKFSQEKGMNLFPLLYASLAYTLHRYCNQTDIVLGAVVSNRHNESQKNIIGPLINTIPLRIKIDDDDLCEDLLKKADKICLNAFEHQDFPLDDIVKLSNEDIARGEQSLINVLIILQNKFQGGLDFKLSDLNISPFDIEHHINETDLVFDIYQSQDDINISLQYADNKFTEQFVMTLLTCYENVLMQMTSDGLTKVSNINLIPEKQAQYIREYLNKTEKDIPKDNLGYLFKKIVGQYPNKLAVSDNLNKLSYLELDEKSNQLANFIESQIGAGINKKIAICLKRDTNLIIAILAIVKTGAAYLPIDPDYPDARIKYILQSANPDLILTNSWFSNIFKKDMIENVCLDTCHYQNHSIQYEIKNNITDPLAYIIFTSGSTGQPKGVLMAHRGIINLVTSYIDAFKITSSDRFSQIASFSFDAFGCEMWPALLSGASLHIAAKEQVLNIEYLIEWISKEKLTICDFPTQLAEILFTKKWSSTHQLRILKVGGEQLKSLPNNDLGFDVINTYGPTETCIESLFTTIYQNGKVCYDNNSQIPIGYPHLNTKVYVLSKNLQICPIGVIGELYISGLGLAEGYLNDEKLTKERFIDNPFVNGQQKQNGYHRLYKTGDLVRYTENGAIDYVGRVDDQVKIRGFRIEPNEVANVILTFNEIQQVVVIAKKDQYGHNYLAAYFTSKNNISISALKVFLENKVPDYMIPKAFLQITEIPLTVNNKVDYQSLPEIGVLKTNEVIGPSNKIELELCEIWERVLGLKKISVLDNFFNIGGDSILSIRIVSQIKELGYQISVKDIFSKKNIRKIAEDLMPIQDNGVTQDKYIAFSLSAETERNELLETQQFNGDLTLIDLYPASLLQQGMLLESERSNGSKYQSVVIYKINRIFDEGKFKQCWQKLINRHELLRVSFHQSALNGYNLALHQSLNINNKYSHEYCEQVTAAYQQYVLSQQDKRFIDMTIPGLFFLHVVQSKNQEGSFFIYLSIHHAIEDGWSTASLFSEFTALYLNENINETAFNYHYAEYIAAEKRAIENNKNKEFWQRYLQAYEFEKLSLGSISSKKGDNYFCRQEKALGNDLIEKITSFAKQLGVPVDTVYLAAYFALLARFDKQDVLVGLVCNNRPEILTGDKLFGLFLNTIPLRLKVNFNELASEFISKVQTEKEKIQDHKIYPSNQIQLDLKQDKLFQCGFNYVHFHVANKYLEEDVMAFLGGVTKASIPLFLEIVRTNKETNVVFAVNHSLISPQIIPLLYDYYFNYLEMLVSSGRVMSTVKADELFYAEKQLPLLSEEQIGNTIVSHFKTQAKKFSDKIAVYYNNEKITYAELDKKSDQLAQYLINQYQEKTGLSMQKEMLIPICLKRSINTVIALLAVLKTGAAYLPLDENYPEERIRYILKNADARMLITQTNLAKRFIDTSDTTLSIINIDQISYQSIDKLQTDNRLSDTDLAYVIYTSGTTGKPKGVMVEHHSVINIVESYQENFQINSTDKLSQIVSFAFDVYGCEIWPALLSGASLHIANQETILNINLLLEWIKKEKVTVVDFPTQLGEILFKVKWPDDHAVRLVIIGGEQSTYLPKHKETYEIINGYGPTEACIYASFSSVYKNQTACYQNDDIPIGRAHKNIRLYVLNESCDLCPAGVAGELYITGDCLARGYFKSIELTREKFIENPFVNWSKNIKSNKLYKTGDIVRWRFDGQLEYLGRTDSQIKIRGFRVDIKEIEAALMRHAKVMQAYVTSFKQEKQTHIIAYYLLAEPISNEELVDYTKTFLPEYMLPSLLIAVDKFPITAHGKIDAKALPKPEIEKLTANSVLPQTPIQQKCAQIWSELLGLKSIGITDDFFKLGGNSILGIQVCHRMSKLFNKNIVISSLFEQKTIQKMCELMQDVKASDYDIKVTVDTKYPVLSFAQERLWFIEQYEENCDAYHIPFLFKINNTLDITCLKDSLKLLVTRHHVLRTLIKVNNNGVLYQSVEENSLDISHDFLTSLNFKQSLQQAITAKFNLAKEFPIRINLFQLDNDDKYLLINIHHIAFDAWSSKIFFKELNDIYHYKRVGQNPHLPAIDAEYLDYASWQRKFLMNMNLDKQINYWQQKLMACPPINLATDKARPAIFDYQGYVVKLMLPKQLSQLLIDFSAKNGVTLFTLLISGLYITLYKYTGQTDLTIGSPLSNRNHHQLENIIGFFVNMVALRNQLNKKQFFKDFIKQAHQTLHEAQMNQDLPFEKLLSVLDITRDQSRHPLFQIIFGIEDAFISEDVSLYNDLQYCIEDEYYNPAKFDLSIFFKKVGLNLELNITYATSLFTETSMNLFAERYLKILEQVISRPESSLESYQLINTLTETQKINEFSFGENKLLGNLTCDELFCQQAALQPEKIALVYQDKSLSYNQLVIKITQLSSYLNHYYSTKLAIKLSPNTLIGVCVERGLEMVISIMAILQAGAAYVPIDPKIPENRIKYMVCDSQLELLITDDMTFNTIHNLKLDCEILNFHRISFSDIPDKTTNSNKSQTDLAYAIYTSGTTGQPKGVLLKHQGITNLISFYQETIQLDKNDIRLQFSSLNFDASIPDILVSLALGATIHIADENIRLSAPALHAYMKQHKITSTLLPPAILRLLPQVPLPDLRKLEFGGETLDKNAFQYWATQTQLINLYGPTEITVCATYHFVEQKNDSPTFIGKPLPGVKLYVLDEDLHQVPIGIRGELYISGKGLAQGYLNNQELTSSRFIPNPFLDSNEKMYKTGDLVKWHDNGILEYLGRNDQQIKLNGYRIELSEIEQTLMEHEKIAQVCVILIEEGVSPYLAAYYVMEENQQLLDEDDYYQFLTDRLPFYMVPKAYKKLISIPIAIQGKVDRQQLPKIDIAENNNNIEPKTPVEITLAKIWCELLNIEKVGLNNNFFKSGGHSLLVTQLVIKIEQAFSYSFTIKEIFNHPILVEQANLISLMLSAEDSEVADVETFEI